MASVQRSDVGHFGYSLELTARGPNPKHRARCSCGWASVALPTAGMAGAAWDLHVAEAEDD